MTFPTPNTDESLSTDNAPFIGNFHKTLPHDRFGEVDPSAYRQFERICMELDAGQSRNFNDVPGGPLNTTAAPAQSAFHAQAATALTTSVAKFTSPMSGVSSETLGPDPKSLEMPPAPSCRSLSATAEMVELYWMALLRDVPLVAFQSSAVAPSAGCAPISSADADKVTRAIKAVNTVFDIAVTKDSDPGRLRAPTDLAGGTGGANIKLDTLFRGGLRDEQHGPLISQFFLQSIGFGTQTIDTRQVPYIAGQDFLVTHGDWLLAQNTGKDKYGRDYGNCNNHADQLSRGANYYPTQGGVPIKRHIATMRDIARFVNRDALHQAYFNAALFLLGINAPLDQGNPYRGHRYAREGAFATLGGPDVLTLVSEVASRALKVVWRQKWLVHRRARPEVMGGLIQMQLQGFAGEQREYGLAVSIDGKPDFAQAFQDTLDAVKAHNAAQPDGAPTLFLPMAFSAGSPSHPAYGAGHATVAGACVTVLKAWFDEDARLSEVYAAANHDATVKALGPKDPSEGPLKLLQPGYRQLGGRLDDFCEPVAYTAAAATRMTVGGELNKVAANVAMGRSMGGVHWRTDNTRSLRLGEAIGIEILRKRTAEYAELPVSFTFRSFDGQTVHIAKGIAQIID